MIKCPNPECGHENVDGTQFCEGCGEELPQPGAASAAAADMATSGMEIKCPACDNLNPPGNVICEVCGADLGPGTAAVPATPIAAATSTPFDTPVSSDAPPTDAAAADGAAAADAAAPDTDDAASAVAAPVSAPVTTPTSPAITTAPSTADAADMAAPADTAVTDTTVADTAVTDTTVADTAVADTAVADTAVADTADDAAGIYAPVHTAAPSTPAPADTAAPAPVAPPAAGASLQPGHVKLTVEQGMVVGAQFILGDAEMLVGREDDEEEIYPDIDLSDQDAGFVHRRHANLKFENDGLTVTHLGGTNKTRVNNKPIPDNVPQPVKLGDKIAFGKVVLRVLPA